MNSFIVFTLVVYLGLALVAGVYIYISNNFIKPYLMKDVPKPPRPPVPAPPAPRASTPSDEAPKT